MISQSTPIYVGGGREGDSHRKGQGDGGGADYNHCSEGMPDHLILKYLCHPLSSVCQSDSHIFFPEENSIYCNISIDPLMIKASSIVYNS